VARRRPRGYVPKMYSPPGLVTGSTNDDRISVEAEVMRRIVPFMVFPHQVERAWLKIKKVAS
jgi:hypothetical protein